METETYVLKYLPRPCGHDTFHLNCKECEGYNAKWILEQNRGALIEVYFAFDTLGRRDLGDKLQDISFELDKLINKNPISKYVKEEK